MSDKLHPIWRQPKPEQRFDVVIFNCETRIIDTVAGTNLGEHGFHTADKRLATVLERINERFDAEAVPAGVYKKGDVLPEKP